MADNSSVDHEPRAQSPVMVVAPPDGLGGEGPVRLRSAAVVVTLASRVALLVLTFVTAVLLARGLGPADRGVLALAMLAAQAAVLVCGVGVGIAATHFAARADQREGGHDGSPSADPEVSRAVATLTLAGSAVALLLFAGLAELLARSNSAAVSGLTPVLMLVAGASVPPGILLAGLTGLLRGRGAMRAAAVVDSAQGAVVLAASAVLILVVEGGVAGALWAQVIGALAATAAALVALRGRRMSFRPTFHRATLRRMLGYGLRGDAGNLTYLVTLRFDTFVVNAVSGNAALGVYTVAARIADIVWLVPYSVALVLLPHASGGDSRALDRSTPRLAVRTLGLSLLVAGLLATLGRLALTPVFGAAYADAYAPMLVLLPGVALFGFGNVLAADLAGRGRPGYITLNAVVGLVLTVGLDLLVIPVHGVMGAAAVSTGVYTVNAALSLAFFLSVTGLSLPAFGRAAIGGAR